MPSFSSSWVSDLSCSSTSSVPIFIQWLRFIFFSPCPQRALLHVDLLFLLLLVIFALQKLFSRSSSTARTQTNGNAELHQPLIGDGPRTLTRTYAWFKTTLIVFVLPSFCSIVLCVLVFTRKEPTQTPLKFVDALFWLVHAVTDAILAVLILHEKRFKAGNHPLSLRIYWVSSFIVTILFGAAGLIHFFSGETDATSLVVDDVASVVSFLLSAVLLLVSVRGTTGVVTESEQEEEEENSPAKQYDFVLDKSENVSLFASLRLCRKPSLSPEHTAERLA